MKIVFDDGGFIEVSKDDSGCGIVSLGAKTDRLKMVVNTVKMTEEQLGQLLQELGGNK